ncbi:hypothetical protein VM98_03135 [Streptomyces rubellomurinus subsp. indigoferus]|nr:hypothetical protein VM98_03135 [Streptomyces rubellomurinus subsp. indigoferus]
MTGEAQDVSVHPIELIIGDKTLVTQVAFMDGRASYGVVGQTGFFDQFVITFDRKNEEVTINTDA